MKKVIATILLIILAAVVLLAGFWEAVSSFLVEPVHGGSIILIVVFPAPLVFVCRFFQNKFGFTKTKFILCTLILPTILLSLSGMSLMVWGLAGFTLSIPYYFAVYFYIISTAIWLLVKVPCRRKVPAIILLTVISVLILLNVHNIPQMSARWFWLIDPSIAVRQIFNALINTMILMLPLGYGVSALMKIYRDEYSLKPPLFMLCAFAPALIIAGVQMPLYYYSDERYSNSLFKSSRDSFIFTAMVAIFSVIIYAVTEQIRRKRKAIDTP